MITNPTSAWHRVDGSWFRIADFVSVIDAMSYRDMMNRKKGTVNKVVLLKVDPRTHNLVCIGKRKEYVLLTPAQLKSGMKVESTAMDMAIKNS